MPLWVFPARNSAKHTPMALYEGYLRFDVEPHKSLMVTATPTYVRPSGRGARCTCGFSQLAALPSIRRGKGDTTASSGGETLLKGDERT